MKSSIPQTRPDEHNDYFWLLVVSCWLLVVSCFALRAVVGCWLLVAGVGMQSRRLLLRKGGEKAVCEGTKRQKGQRDICVRQLVIYRSFAYLGR